jgi:hypothetical protein
MDIWVYGKFIMSGENPVGLIPLGAHPIRERGNYEEKRKVQARVKGKFFNVNSMKIFDSDTHRPDTLRCASD